MSLAIHLLGRPYVVRPDGDGYVIRSRKTWALLTFLLLSERAPSRARTAALPSPSSATERYFRDPLPWTD